MWQYPLALGSRKGCPTPAGSESKSLRDWGELETVAETPRRPGIPAGCGQTPPKILGINEFFPYKALNWRADSARGQEPMLSPGTIARAALFASVMTVALCAAPTVRADNSKQQDGWHIVVQGPFGFSSGGAPGSFFFQSTPGTAFSSANGTRGFNDYSLAHALSLGRELGIGNVEGTLGVRVAEPLVTNGFTPAFDDRRFVGAGPRVGLQGSNRFQSAWSVDWQVGAAWLTADRFDAAGGTSAALPNYAANSGSVVNFDGLLGLSYWFDAASKLTLGYRADAYLNKTPAINFGTAPQSTIDHGPMIKFTIQK
jgi:hypothetical protein